MPLRSSNPQAFARDARSFSIVLIKPSHYDDDGYVIQWFRSAVPSNSLAVMHGLTLDCRARRVLGPEIELDIQSMDEDNTCLLYTSRWGAVRSCGPDVKSQN